MSGGPVRTPAEHLGILVDPSGPELVEALANPRRIEAKWLDSTIERLRDDLLSELNLTPPVVATGHQAEFYGPGVFAKTIMADVLAAAHGASALFVSVDSDAAKSPWLEFPRMLRDDGAERYARGRAALAGVTTGRPMEHQPRVGIEEACAAVESARQGGLLPGDSLAPVVIGAIREAAVAGTVDWMDALTAAQAAVECELGLQPVRVERISRICDTRTFAAFAAGIMLRPEPVHSAYDRAIHAARADGGPAAAAKLLLRRGGFEVPLWFVRPGEARRRMFVRRWADRVELLADGEDIAAIDPAELTSGESASAALSPGRLGWLIRPRAITLSAFMRLFVADLFLHGLGGVAYDRATELFARAAWNVELRPMACVTATLHLRPDLLDGIATAERVPASVHELNCNPDRWLANLSSELQEARRVAVADVVMLRKTQQWRHDLRRAAFNRIRAINHAMLRADSAQVAELERRMVGQRARAAERNLLSERGWYFGFHSRAALAELRGRLAMRLR